MVLERDKRRVYYRKKILQVLAAHTCNLSNLGGRDEED
jgi:hypothetical protein